MDTLEIERTARITRCSQAVMRFFSALDAGDIAAVSACMAEDGVWHRQGQALRGPDQVLAALRQRPPGRVTAHLVNNLVIELDPSSQQATASYMLLVFRHDHAQAAQAQVAPISTSLLSITATTDLWREIAPGQWRAVSKQGQPLFTQTPVTRI